MPSSRGQQRGTAPTTEGGLPAPCKAVRLPSRNPLTGAARVAGRATDDQRTPQGAPDHLPESPPSNSADSLQVRAGIDRASPAVPAAAPRVRPCARTRPGGECLPTAGSGCETGVCFATSLYRHASVALVTGPRSSAGGAAAAAGPGFESRVLAWLAGHVIARVPVPASWRVSAAQVQEIGGQTGQEMDDIGAITDRGGYVFIQAKLRLQLGEHASSPLAEAIDQAVRQFIDGAPAGPDGTRRSLEPGRDALVICTDAGASAPVRNDLRAVVTRLAGHPRELPLDQLATNHGERRALKVLLARPEGSFREASKRDTSQRGAAAGDRPPSARDHIGGRSRRRRSSHCRNAPPGYP